METEKKYNGWTNRDTWALNLHMENNEGNYEFFQAEAKDIIRKAETTEDAIFIFADRIEEWYNEIRDNVLCSVSEREYEPTEEAINLIRDVSSDDDINFNEIAKGIIETIINDEKEAV